MNEVWQLYAEYYADYDDVVNVKSGKNFNVADVCFFAKRNNYILAVD